MKDAILKLAEQQLLTGGYGKLNFGQIATALDTTRANLHYHFKNKESLAVAVLQEFGARQIAGFEAMRNAYDGDLPGFAARLDESFWTADPDDLRSCTLLAADPDLPAPLRALTEDFYMHVERCILSVLDDAKSAGRIRADIDCSREAARCHALLMGIMTSLQHMDPGQAWESLNGLITDWAAGLA